MLANIRRKKDVFTFLGGFVWVLGALAKVISINIVFQIQIHIVGGMDIMYIIMEKFHMKGKGTYKPSFFSATNIGIYSILTHA